LRIPAVQAPQHLEHRAPAGRARVEVHVNGEEVGAGLSQPLDQGQQPRQIACAVLEAVEQEGRGLTGGDPPKRLGKPSVLAAGAGTENRHDIEPGVFASGLRGN